MAHLKVLLVSIACPPKSDPESIQVARYIKYIAKSDLSLSILTSKNPTLYMETDSMLEEYLRGINKISQVHLIELRFVNSILNKLVPSLMQYPDSKWSFYRRTPRGIEIPDLVYSRSYPLSSTLMALKLKKKWNVPWILHLSDPWSISYKGDSPSTNFLPGPRRWNRKKEIECFEFADRISFTSSKTLLLYGKYLPQFKDKFFLTPNVYDDDLISNRSPDFSNKLMIVYTGGFGEKRDPAFFLRTITEFLSENPEMRNRIKFVFTGPMTRKNKITFESLCRYDEVEYLGVINYDSMLEYQRNAHVLVNIDTNISSVEHSVFFPSKLLEYFAAKRRILAIGNAHSMTYSVINDYGDFVEFDDKARLKNLFKQYWLKFTEKSTAFFSPDFPLEDYSASKNAAKLAQLMKSTIQTFNKISTRSIQSRSK